ncbi:MAG: TfoX/Sxy family protein [Flavobacteriales bacterium]|nr:TfoX/Sxy family protein [Flavobacteriales bacterium]
MAEDAYILERIRNALREQRVSWTEKRMFGGNCFMVDDKMLLGTYKGGIMARVDPQRADALMSEAGGSQMNHGGRPMTGYVMLEIQEVDREDQLEFWVARCLEFNPKAKSSKKK